MPTDLRARLANADAADTARATFTLIDCLQHEPDPAIRLAAMLCCSQLAADHIHDHHDISHADQQSYVRNLMRHAQGKRHEFAAADTYLTREVFSQL